MKIHHENAYEELTKKLFSQCEKCCGLCCVALYFSKSEGFPEDKMPGKPCMHLLSDFRCRLHSSLEKEGLKGCMSFDCFGAGSHVTQVNFKNKNWQSHPEIAEEMYATYLGIHQYHQMLWYLIESASIVEDAALAKEIDALIAENEKITALDAQAFLGFDRSPHRQEVNGVLKRVCALMKDKFPLSAEERVVDFMGYDLSKQDLSGRDFSFTLMVAANLKDSNLLGVNLLGTDLRDANLCDADLSEALFLTQMQVNAAKGNKNTKLPPRIMRPKAWEK